MCTEECRSASGWQAWTSAERERERLRARERGEVRSRGGGKGGTPEFRGRYEPCAPWRNQTYAYSIHVYFTLILHIGNEPSKFIIQIVSVSSSKYNSTRNVKDFHPRTLSLSVVIKLKLLISKPVQILTSEARLKLVWNHMWNESLK